MKRGTIRLLIYWNTQLGLTFKYSLQYCKNVISFLEPSKVQLFVKVLTSFLHLQYVMLIWVVDKQMNMESMSIKLLFFCSFGPHNYMWFTCLCFMLNKNRWGVPFFSCTHPKGNYNGILAMGLSFAWKMVLLWST